MANFSVFAIRSKHPTRFLLFLVFILFFYCEFVSYWILPWMWMKQPICPSPHCKKLLLVSDPQIIGPEWKRFFLMDIFAIWDSDRYLKRTFQQAVNYLQPDVVIFLGDLMDQGHTATDAEFDSYMKRLKYLFELPKWLENTKVIIIPGDNDVGGVDDVLVPGNVHRFNRKFNQTDECGLTEFIEFCKVNLMTLVIQESKFVSRNMIRVALSHVPLTPKKTYFLKEVIKKIRPNLIFSGHVHTSSHYATNENDLWSYKHSSISPEETISKFYRFHNGSLHEIVVPTCSYRMGVSDMGYGAAFIDTKGQYIRYNVLWLPHRYRQMLIYSVIVLPLIIALVAMTLKRSRWCRNRHSNKTFASQA